MTAAETHERASELPLAMVRGALFAALVALVLPTAADTDLWGHVRFGLDALSELSLASRDPYSFTSDREWINHEWLAEVAMALAYRAAGASGLTILKVAVVALALLAAAACLGVERRHTWRTDAVLAFVGVAGLVALTLTLRPQVFSVLAFAVLMLLMRLVDAGRTRVLWAVPVLFLLWANAHGGWMVGGAALALWTAAAVVEARHDLRRAATLAIVGAAAAAATLVNPYGIGLWQFLFDTVGFSRSDIGEWNPISVHRELLIPWVATTALFLASLAAGRGWRWGHVLVGLFLAYASFKVARLGAFYAMAVGLLVAPALLHRAPDVRATGGPALRARRFGIAAITFAAVVLSFVMVNRSNLSCVRPHGSVGLDLPAAAFIQQRQLSGRIVVWFNWGEFVIWHFAPDLKVSMDGRRETVYSAVTLEAHQRLWRAAPDAQEYLASLQPDYIWIPNTLPLNRALPQWGGWQPAFSTAESTVWSRRAVSAARADATAPNPCFPGLAPAGAARPLEH